MKGEDDYEVVIEFDTYGTDLVRSRKWHPSQEFTELPVGGSQLRMRLSSVEEIEKSVLSWVGGSNGRGEAVPLGVDANDPRSQA